MRGILSIFFLLFTCSVSFAQVQLLQEYIEQGHRFDEICKKAEKMIKKNKLEDDNYREGVFRKSERKDFLDDEKLKYERWKWYWRDRVTEDGEFPDLLRQYELYEHTLKQSAQSYRNPVSWKHEGPVRNTGGYWGMGRTTHVSFHPTQLNTFYVASPNGGIWKTLDGGKTYSSIADDLPYQPVGVVLVNPQNPNMLYATLGEKEGWWQYSLGVYKTTNGGTSWAPTSLNWKLTDNKVIYNLEMNPANPSILMAATSDGIYKTFNGGNSWIRIRTENFSDVKYKPGDTSIVYAASNDYWGTSEVFRSNDGGNTFQKMSNFGLNKVFLKFATTLADPTYLGVNMSVDGAKKFYLSKNSGQSFDYISDMPENLVLYFSQNNKNIVYCGYVVVYRSSNGGKDWTQITDWWASGQGLPEVHADHHFIGHHPSKRDELYFGCDGGVYRYTESTGFWDELVNGLAITQFYKMAISTTQPPVLIGGSQDNGGWLRRANGSWGNTNGGDAMSQVIDPTNPNIAYTEYWGGNAVYRTTNGFNNLTDITANIGAELPGQWVTPFSLNPKNPKTFIIGYNEIFVSHDRGNTFKKISNNLTGNKDNDLREVKISPVDTNFIVASRSNILYTTNDYGKNWKTSSLIGSLEITGIEFHPKDQNRLWCTRGALGSIKVMSSVNKGNSWVNITKNMVNTPVLCITYDEPSNTLFIGTDFGVFYSDADSIDWQMYGQGLPYTSVTDLKIHETQRKLYVSTYGRGFYSVDLPGCAPSKLELFASLNSGPFNLVDSIKVCAGSNIVLKVQDGLKGSFFWRGPNKFEEEINNQVFIDLGQLNSFTQSGNYILTYNSPANCVREDTVYIRVLNRPNFMVRADGPQLDCHHPSLILNPGMTNDSTNFSFQWTGPDSFKLENYIAIIDNPGTYKLNLKNLAGDCSFYDSISIIKFEDPEIDSVQLKHNLCYGDKTASIDLQINKGRMPYSIIWNNGKMTSNISGLSSGIYNVRVLDANQCLILDSFEIIQPDSFKVDIQVVHSTADNGEITLSVEGASPAYTYQWYKDGQFYSSDKNLQDLKPGLYDLLILDANGCEFRRDGIEVKEAVVVDHQKDIRIEFYPNPAENWLSLRSAKFSFEKAEIKCFTLDGKTIETVFRYRENNEVILNIDHLITGNYILKIKKGNYTAEIKFAKR